MFKRCRTPQEDYNYLNTCNFVLVAHDGKADPVFNYANQHALNLWEMSWEEFTNLPSRKSAEEDLRSDRAKMLKEAEEKGYFSNYSGVRISKTGKRFRIKNATVFNVYNDNDEKIGQAAYFTEIEPLSE